MPDIFAAFAWMLIGHAVADYPLQGNPRWKSSWSLESEDVRRVEVGDAHEHAARAAGRVFLHAQDEHGATFWHEESVCETESIEHEANTMRTSQDDFN